MHPRAACAGLLDFETARTKLKMVNNYDWFSIIVLTFPMTLENTSQSTTWWVKNLLKTDWNRISYTEFAYQIMQGIRLFYLKSKRIMLLCKLVVLISGEIWLLEQNSCVVVDKTDMPLCSSYHRCSGKKFGKSEGNAVWLNADKIHP